MSTWRIARGAIPPLLLVAGSAAVAGGRLLVLALHLALALRWRRRFFRLLRHHDVRAAHRDGDDRVDADVLVDGAAGREVLIRVNRAGCIAAVHGGAAGPGRGAVHGREVP